MQPFSLPFSSIETKRVSNSLYSSHNHQYGALSKIVFRNVTILLPNLQTLRLSALCEIFFLSNRLASAQL